MWLDNLKEAKSKKGMSSKKLAEVTNLPERTVIRIFSGDTDNPYVDTIHRIAVALDTTLDEIFGDSKAVVGTKDLATLQEEADKLTAELDMIRAEYELLKAEKALQDAKLVTLAAENSVLQTKLEHKEEIIRLHNYYGAVISGLTKN